MADTAPLPSPRRTIPAPAEEAWAEERTGWRKLLIFGTSTVAAVAAVVLWIALAAFLLWLIFFLFFASNGKVGVKVEAPPPVAINMLPPPPPPPPPPEPQTKPPEPTDAPNPVPNPEPAKAPDAPAPMTIAGPAQAGTDSFGLQSGSGTGTGAPSSGGTCIGTNCGTGKGPGGGGGISDGFYTRYLAGALQERVQDNGKVNRLIFSAGFAITIENGRVASARLVRSTGKPDLDAQLREILEGTRGLTAPPEGWNGRAREVTVRGRRAV